MEFIGTCSIEEHETMMDVEEHVDDLLGEDLMDMEADTIMILEVNVRK